MATDLTPATPPEPKQPLQGDPNRPTDIVLPVYLLTVTLTVIGCAVAWLVYYILAMVAQGRTFNVMRLTDAVRLPRPGSEHWFLWLLARLALVAVTGGLVYLVYRLGRRTPALVWGALLGAVVCTFYLLFGGALRWYGREVDPYFFWVPTLILVLVLGLVYVVWLYVQDSQSVGWAWPLFLGTLRYVAILLMVFVFLLPALQDWEKIEVYPRVLLLLDVSGSMHLADEIAEEGRPAPPTRMDLVYQLLEQKGLLKKLEDKNPVAVYAFGGKLDEDVKVFGERTIEQQAEPAPLLPWYLFFIPALVLAGVFYVVWMFVRDSLTRGWGWAVGLGVVRLAGTTAVAAALLLVAAQVQALGDAEGKKERRPVVAARPAGQISHAELAAWLKLDPKQWLLEDLGDEGKKLVRASTGFDPEKPGSAEWANDWSRTTIVAAQLDKEDREKLEAKLTRLAKKLELRQLMLTGTNYGDSVLTALNRESTNVLAGIIVIGDGQSNQGSPSTYDELRRRASAMKIPIFTVGVGEARELIAIRITDLQAPDQAPPDEKFQVRVEVDGEGLADKDFVVILDIYKPGEPKTPALQLTAPGRFKPGAGVPHGTVEFPIDPAADELAPLRVANSVKPELLEGEWKFVARIAKARGEAFVGKEHVSDAGVVQVVKRPLRVLLFAGGPTREYQFARRLFVNEMDKKRVELSVCLQVTDPKGARVQDVPPERLLAHFPNFLRVDDDPNEKIEDRYYNLAQYDLIVAFDPDWTQVPRASLDLLQKWVEVQAGGLVLIGGPINTYQLARSTNFEKLKPLIELYPVRVEDSRLAGLNVDRTAGKPWRLNFPGVGADTEFLKLDDDKKQPLAGWEEFFTGKPTGTPPQPGAVPTRGFFSYYPVKSVKPTAAVIATFSDPQARLIKDDNTTEEQPYLVTMPFGKGKVVYVSSGELWRLRLYREMFHERLWTKLGRHAAAGTLTRQTRRGSINVGRFYNVGQYVRLNVPLYGPDLQPLPRSAEPVLRVLPPTGSGLNPGQLKLTPRREGDWSGQFEGRFVVNTPGEYQLELPVPGSSEVIRSKFSVKESNPELDNPRPNFGLLRTQLAGSIDDLRVGPTAKADLKRQLQTLARMSDSSQKSVPREPAKDEPTLFFDLRSAATIPEYLSAELRKQWNRGPAESLWDKGLTREQLIALLHKVGLVLAVVTLVLGTSSFFGDNRKTRRAVLVTLGVLAGAIVIALVADTMNVAVARALFEGYHKVGTGTVAEGGLWLVTVPTMGFQVLAGLSAVLAVTALIAMFARRQGTDLALPLAVTGGLTGAVWIIVGALLSHHPIASLLLPGEQSMVSYILLLVVGLLSLEWLTRKLLRLA